MVLALRIVTISILLGYFAGKSFSSYIGRIHEVENECIFENMQPKEMKNGDIQCRLVEKF